MSTGRLSRPSSAASYSSRHSHASYTSHGSRSSHSSSELKLECKAAYLSVFDDIHDPIPSKQDFILGEKRTFTLTLSVQNTARLTENTRSKKKKKMKQTSLDMLNVEPQV